MRKVFIIILFLICGCDAWHNMRYYKNYNDNKSINSLIYSYDEYKYDERYLEGQSYEEFKNSEKFNAVSNYYKQKNIEWNLDKDRVSREYCTYFLFYFIPINFWNIRFTDKQYINKTIKYFNNKGKEGDSIRNIYIKDRGFDTPIFSYFCFKVSGELVNEEINNNKNIENDI